MKNTCHKSSICLREGETLFGRNRFELKCFPKDGSPGFSSPHPAASPPSPPPWSSLGLPNWRKLHSWWFVHLEPNQQTNGLTFTNFYQNTVQITPIQIIVSLILQNSTIPEPVWSIFASIALSWSLFQNLDQNFCKIYFIQFHKAILLQGLFITGGTVGRWYVRPLPPFPIPSWSQVPQPSTEMFPATLCPVKPFPIPPHPIPPPPSPHNPLRFPKSKGLYGHSLSVVDNGRKLVACGGMTEQWIFGGIGIGFGDGGIDVVLYSSPEARTVCISWQDGQDGWTLDLKMM